jgi:hypothetical protein
MGSPLPPCRCVGPASGYSRALPVPEGGYAIRDPSTRPATSARHDTTVSFRAVWLCGVHPAKGGRSFGPASEYDLRPPPRGPCAARDRLQGQHRAPASPHPSTSRHGFTDQGPKAPDPAARTSRISEVVHRGAKRRRSAGATVDARGHRGQGTSRIDRVPAAEAALTLAFRCGHLPDAGSWPTVRCRGRPRRRNARRAPYPGSTEPPKSAPRVPRATRRSPAVACRSSADAPCVACDAPRIQRREHTLQVR